VWGCCSGCRLARGGGRGAQRAALLPRPLPLLAAVQGGERQQCALDPAAEA